MADPTRSPIPITVIGGYLGAGKTTLLNRLLREPGGRRLGVIVNDFGSIGIDAELLAASSDTGVVNLPNGCVCCSLGGDLYASLRALSETDDPPDQIVIEASGVADPAVAAAWGTSDGFEPGGVIVLAAADSIRQQLVDKYVGGEVRRQLVGADLVLVTKADLCDDDDLESVDRLLSRTAPRAFASFRVDLVDADFVFGFRPADVPDVLPRVLHHYTTWSWTGAVVPETALRRILGQLPPEVMRLKGVVSVGPNASVIVQFVAGSVSIELLQRPADQSRLVAILRRGGSLTAVERMLDNAILKA